MVVCLRRCYGLGRFGSEYAVSACQSGRTRKTYDIVTVQVEAVADEFIGIPEGIETAVVPYQSLHD